MKNIKKYIREPINGLTHGIGALLAVVGLVLLLYNAIAAGSVSKIVAYTIFGSSMVLLYASSSLYHSLPVKEKTLQLFRKLDHVMIYVLIAGSYTPICLLVLDEDWRWIIFSAVWCVALIGIIKKIVWTNVPHWLSLTFYLAMGWVGIFLFPSIIQKMPVGFLLWIIAGGLSYTVGAVIFGVQKPNPIPDWFGHHEIWHLFVMMGTFSHFWAFYWFLS
jgi:hemolysin III